MPWKVEKSDRCPIAKPWAVIKKDGGKLVGCHPSKEVAQKQIEAIKSKATITFDQAYFGK